MARLSRAFRLIAARRTRCACASLDRPSPFSSLKFAARDPLEVPREAHFSSRGEPMTGGNATLNRPWGGRGREKRIDKGSNL